MSHNTIDSEAVKLSSLRASYPNAAHFCDDRVPMWVTRPWLDVEGHL
ncbi:hypothetical protein [Rhodococcus sp. USK13]|nr:hypothetical protein [Rhodococcus sp. USK13]